MDERGASIRILKTELESERSDKLYYLSEIEALTKERVKLENEMQAIKQKHREHLEKEDLNASNNAVCQQKILVPDASLILYLSDCKKLRMLKYHYYRYSFV